jgi:hypothetical protein
MKRYISSILIPCLLLQLCGCYSYREITLDELKSYTGEKDIKITTGEKDIIINRDSTESCIMNWGISDSSIIVQERTIPQWDPFNKKPIDKKDEIKFHQIKHAAIEEPDSEKTLFAVLFMVLISVILIAASSGNLITPWEW